MGIGVVAVVGWVGAAVGWLGSGTLAAGMVSGALVGAAIGGLSTAVLGGNILEGVLFGAIGGAVTGGLGTLFSGAGGAGTLSSGAGGAVSTGVVAPPIAPVVTGTVSIGNKLASLGGTMLEKGASAIGGHVVTGGLQAYLAGDAQEVAGEQALALSAQEHEQSMLQIAAANKGFDPANMASVNVRTEELASARKQYTEGRDLLAAEKATRLENIKGYGGRGVALAPSSENGESVLTAKEATLQNNTTALAPSPQEVIG